MHQREQLLSLAGPAPRFPIVFRGYDRAEVDSWLESQERQPAEAEAGQLVRAEDESKQSEPTPPDSLAAVVLDRARDVARQLPVRVVREAEAERDAIRRGTVEAIDRAQARSAQIVEAARRDRDHEAAEARRQIELLRLEASDGARERVHRTWNHATSAVTEADLELVGLRARRQIILTELARLERSLAESREQLGQRGIATVEAHDRPRHDHPHHDDVVPAQEKPRWALMPLEW